MGLPYPGGPQIAALAVRGQARFKFPRPMVNRPGLDFSFSGLKTFAYNTIAGERSADGDIDPQTMADIARSFEDAVVDTLVIKCRRALEQEGLSRLIIAGGVSANHRLRQQLQQSLAERGATVHYARPALCTDNGAMIAYAGCQRLLAGASASLAIFVRPRWPLAELTAPSEA